MLARLVRLTMTSFVVALGATVLCAQAGSDEERARQVLQSGQALLTAQNTTDGLAALQSLVTDFPKTSVADDALLAIARGRLEALHDAKGASEAASRLLSQYGESDSVPVAQVLRARADAAGASDQMKGAIAELERVARTYPRSTAAAEALFYAAQFELANGATASAMTRLDDLVSRYPTDTLAPQALLDASSLMAVSGQAPRAMDQLQRLRRQFPGTPAAATALDRLTILYRLYLKGSSQPLYTFSHAIAGPSGRIADFRDVAVGRDNHLLIATRSGVSETTAEGQQLRFVAVQEPRSVFLNAGRQPFTVHDQGTIRREGRPPLVFATERGKGRMEPLEIDAAVALSTDDVIVASRAQRSLVRFSSEGAPKGDFAKGVAGRRLAVGGHDDVAALDTEQKTVVVLGRDGRVIGRVAERGASYQLRDPVDVGFDGLGHLYVLERGAVFVFSHAGDRLLATFAVPKGSAGSLTNSTAMAVDSAGRLYVFDDRADVVQVFK